MTNVRASDLRKALENRGWRVEPGKGSHVNCYKNGVKLNFEGQKNKPLGKPSIARNKVEEAEGISFSGESEFADWVDEHKRKR